MKNLKCNSCYYQERVTVFLAMVRLSSQGGFETRSAQDTASTLMGVEVVSHVRR